MRIMQFVCQVLFFLIKAIIQLRFPSVLDLMLRWTVANYNSSLAEQESYCNSKRLFILATKNHPQYNTDLCVVSCFSSPYVAWLVCTLPGIQICVRCQMFSLLQ